MMTYQETTKSWDFVGVTFVPLDKDGQEELDKKVYSQDVHLYRVSSSNRYEDSLIPALKHQTVEVPGGDGTYWFGAVYTQKPLKLDFAYDELTESDLRILKNLFNGKNRLHVIFDEVPYKYYDVVVQSAPQFRYVPFVIEGSRIYKGEGSVSLVSYDPYAYGADTYLDNAPRYANDSTYTTYASFPNYEEWNTSVFIPPARTVAGTTYNECPAASSTNAKINLWNGGDLPTPIQIVMDSASFNKLERISLIKDGSEVTAIAFTSPSAPANIMIDTRLHLVYSGDTFLNRYVTAGNFFDIPPVESVTLGVPSPNYQLGFEFSSAVTPSVAVDYKYKFY